MGNRGYASKILQSLLAHGEDIIGICCRKDNRSFISSAKKYIRSKLPALEVFNRECFEYINPFDTFKSPKDIAFQKKIPILYAKKLRTPEFELALRNLNPDLILVAGFHRLIPPNIIKIPKKAIINFHPSLLPKHRGGTPNRWVIRNGERETGVTAHFVNEKFDCGDIIAQEKLSVYPNETWGELELRLIGLVEKMVFYVLERLKTSTVQNIPQNDELSTYELSFKGVHQQIDWAFPSYEIKQICYAMRPKSGGSTFLNNKKICIWDVEVIKGIKSSHLPGTIIDIDKDGYPVVSCGEGAVRILFFLQFGKIIKASKIVKMFRIQKDTVFG